MSALDVRATLSWLRTAVVQAFPGMLMLAAGIILLGAVDNSWLYTAVLLLTLVSLTIRDYRADKTRIERDKLHRAAVRLVRDVDSLTFPEQLVMSYVPASVLAEARPKADGDE